MKPESNRPITIEDLLRLKRAERPPVEFWATFDRELRAKQLAALVEKRPWWQTLPRAVARFTHYRVMLGASAVAVVTFFSVRDNQTSVPAEPVSPADSAAVQVVAEAAPQADDGAQNFPATEVQVAVAAVGQTTTEAKAIIGSAPGAGPDVPGAVARADVASNDPVSEVQSPSPLHIAENLATLQASEPTGTRSLLAVASGFEVRAMPARVAVEPLHQMTPPSDSRRARLLTAMVSMGSMESSMRTTERAANRIAEERLYDDQMSRFGARGDRLQVKF